MDGSQGFNGFQFDDEPITDEQIELALPDPLPPVSDGNGNLAAKWDGSCRKLDAEGLLVGRLKETRSQRSMYLQRSTDETVGPEIQLCIWLS